jgi:hypothetical protein
LLKAEAIRQGHKISFALDKKIPAMIINPSQMIHLLYNMNFIAFKYMDISGEVTIRSFMRDEQTLVCSVVSAAEPGSAQDWEQECHAAEQERHAAAQECHAAAQECRAAEVATEINQLDQLSRVCRKVAGGLGGSLEIHPHVGQGVDVSVFFSLT